MRIFTNHTLSAFASMQKLPIKALKYLCKNTIDLPFCQPKFQDSSIYLDEKIKVAYNIYSFLLVR